MCAAVVSLAASACSCGVLLNTEHGCTCLHVAAASSARSCYASAELLILLAWAGQITNLPLFHLMCSVLSHL